MTGVGGSLVFEPPIRCVVVDDVAEMRVVVRGLLRGTGIDIVAEAANGSEALDAITATCPDVVLLDLRMPVMSGIEAMPLIRERCPLTKIVAFSAFARDLTEAAAATADAHLRKTSNREDMVSTIRRLCGRGLEAVGVS